MVPSILERRQLSPEKLRRARLKAGFTNVSEVCRRIGLGRLGYNRWEEAPGLSHFDYLAFRNLCELFGVTYEEVSEEATVRRDTPSLPAPAQSLQPQAVR